MPENLSPEIVKMMDDLPKLTGLDPNGEPAPDAVTTEDAEAVTRELEEHGA